MLIVQLPRVRQGKMGNPSVMIRSDWRLLVLAVKSLCFWWLLWWLETFRAHTSLWSIGGHWPLDCTSQVLSLMIYIDCLRFLYTYTRVWELEAQFRALWKLRFVPSKCSAFVAHGTFICFIFFLTFFRKDRTGFIGRLRSIKNKRSQKRSEVDFQPFEWCQWVIET